MYSSLFGDDRNNTVCKCMFPPLIINSLSIVYPTVFEYHVGKIPIVIIIYFAYVADVKHGGGGGGGGAIVSNNYSLPIISRKENFLRVLLRVFAFRAECEVPIIVQVLCVYTGRYQSRNIYIFNGAMHDRKVRPQDLHPVYNNNNNNNTVCTSRPSFLPATDRKDGETRP